jgi:hypothetical protein
VWTLGLDSSLELAKTGIGGRADLVRQLGQSIEQALNSRRAMTSTTTGVMATTVAVRGRDPRRAISPTYSPAPRTAITFSPRRTSTSPCSTRMNSWPPPLGRQYLAGRELELRGQCGHQTEDLLRQLPKERHVGELRIDPLRAVHFGPLLG